jgi:glucans biosynthesis protein C
MAKGTSRADWVDNLRTCMIVLVVAHHSSLAYTSFAHFDKNTYIDSTAPVVDPSRWVGMDIFENFNDIFFMSLMFLISGLFFYKGMGKKGRLKFLAGRFTRLGLPFIFTVSLIIPFAYIPSFLLANGSFCVQTFVVDYITHQGWPAGPPWFIWVLLCFDILASLIPIRFFRMLFSAGARLVQRPFVLFGIVYLIAFIALTPLSLSVGQYKWTGWGPFDFQLNRILLYFVFFLFGACLGAGDWEDKFFPMNRLLYKNQRFWIWLCLGFYGLLIFFSATGPGFVEKGLFREEAGYLIFDLLFVASCLSSSFAFLAVFKTSFNKQGKFWNILSGNAYGIYLVHYVFVTWMQYFLLNINLPAIIKFLLVFLISFSLSLLLISQARKIKIVKRII